MTGLLDRVPPHSLEAEAAVLGSIILAPTTAMDEAMSLLRGADFYDDANQRIYEAMIAIQDTGKPVDVVLLRERLIESDEWDDVGGAARVATILQSVATAAHVRYYANIVLEKARRRRIIDAATAAIRDAYQEDDSESVIGKLTAELDGIDTRNTAGELVDSHSIASLTVENYESRKSGNSGSIRTGMPTLDTVLGGGFAPTDFVVVGARTSFGKTSLALALLAHIAQDSERVALIFSIEMTREEIADRLAAAIGRLPALKLRLGKLCRDDESRLTETVVQMSQLSFRLDDSPVQTVASIARTARRESRRKPLSCIVVDYLQLLEPTKRADRRDLELSYMARKLKALAQELRCPVICLAQLNKEAEGGRPRMSHIREAESISHEANVVLLLDRPEFNTERPANEGEPCKLIVEKSRNGPRHISVPMLWFAAYTQFVEPAPPALEAPERHKALDSWNKGERTWQ